MIAHPQREKGELETKEDVVAEGQDVGPQEGEREEGFARDGTGAGSDRRLPVAGRTPGYLRTMSIGDLGKKAEQFLDSEQGEQRSDQALDKAEQFADERTGGKYDEQLDKARDAADEHVGQQDPGQ